MACTSCNACNSCGCIQPRSTCGCNSCGSGNVNGITFPDFVANACCNPCCRGNAGYVTTGSCGCGCDD